MKLIKFILLCVLAASSMPSQSWARRTSPTVVCKESVDGSDNGYDCNSNCTCPDDYVCNGSGGCTGGSEDVEVTGTDSNNSESASGHNNTSNTSSDSNTTHHGGSGTSTDSNSTADVADPSEYSEYCDAYGSAQVDCTGYEICMNKVDEDGITRAEKEKCTGVACASSISRVTREGYFANGSYVSMPGGVMGLPRDLIDTIVRADDCVSYFNANTANSTGAEIAPLGIKK